MLASPSVTTSFEAGSLNRFDSVRRRQMVRLRKRSDWFLSPPLGNGASTSLMQDSQCRSSGDSTTHPAESTDPGAASDLPQLCINDSDVVDAESSPTRQRHIDEGYSSRSAVGENSVSLFPSPLENSPSSSTTPANPRPNLSSESSPASTKHLLQSDTHYFLVDRFYGGSMVSEKAENGDAC